MLRLFSYKLTNDSGFAPNPFWGYLTLATCKPRIRASKNVDDWIAGFTSKKLGDQPGQEKLIYLMKITDTLSIAEYFRASRFKNKVPTLSAHDFVHKAGDNIYRPLSQGAFAPDDFEQIANPNHTDKNKLKDLSGSKVLISDDFFYFGRNALVIPSNVRPKVPKGQSSQGVRTDDQTLIQDFIIYVSRHGKGIHGAPHKWPGNDQSWKST